MPSISALRSGALIVLNGMVTIHWLSDGALAPFWRIVSALSYRRDGVVTRSVKTCFNPSSSSSLPSQLFYLVSRNIVRFGTPSLRLKSWGPLALSCPVSLCIRNRIRTKLTKYLNRLSKTRLVSSFDLPGQSRNGDVRQSLSKQWPRMKPRNVWVCPSMRQ